MAGSRVRDSPMLQVLGNSQEDQAAHLLQMWRRPRFSLGMLFYVILFLFFLLLTTSLKHLGILFICIEAEPGNNFLSIFGRDFLSTGKGLGK